MPARVSQTTPRSAHRDRPGSDADALRTTIAESSVGRDPVKRVLADGRGSQARALMRDRAGQEGSGEDKDEEANTQGLEASRGREMGGHGTTVDVISHTSKISSHLHALGDVAHRPLCRCPAQPGQPHRIARVITPRNREWSSLRSRRPRFRGDPE